MILTRQISTVVAAPREHVAALLVRTDLDTLRFYDPRVESVETNGLPDGAVGQVVRMTGRVWGQEVEMVQTTLEAEPPERFLDRMQMPGDALLTQTWLIDLENGSTRMDQTVSFEIAPWKVLKIAATALTASAQLRKAAARFAELAELSYRPA
ncbi:MAG: hypothetical protein M3Y20_02245 [Actinomycetota bacterium]|nr:hypothetical protein [Actinomycetota bacterium]